MNFNPFRKLLRVAYRIGQRLAVLDVSHLLLLEAGRMPLGKPLPDGYSLFVMTPDQLRQFAADPRNELDQAMAYRLLFQRDLCVGVRVDGHLAGYAWFAFGAIEAEFNRGYKPETGVAIAFPSDTVFLYKAFVLPEHRGQGIYGAINRHVLNGLRQRGIQRILATTDWTNDAGLTSCYRQGFRSFGRTYRFGLGRLVAGLYPRRAVTHGIHCGTAVVREGGATITARLFCPSNAAEERMQPR